jgi:hypothetical protein
MTGRKLYRALSGGVSVIFELRPETRFGNTVAHRTLGTNEHRREHRNYDETCGERNGRHRSDLPDYGPNARITSEAHTVADVFELSAFR